MGLNSVLLQSRLRTIRDQSIWQICKHLRDTGWILTTFNCKVELIWVESVSGSDIVRKEISIWAESSAGDGSWNPSFLNGGASFASLTKVKWSISKGRVRGPVLVVFHSSRATSWSKLYHIELDALQKGKKMHLVFCMLVEKDINTTTWSVKFFPTLGFWTRVSTPATSSSSRFPIPECRRIWGVPNTPPAKITSFPATILLDLPLTPEPTSTTRNSVLSCLIGMTLVTCVLRSMCTLFPVWLRNAVAPLLRSKFGSTVYWFQPIGENIKYLSHAIWKRRKKVSTGSDELAVIPIKVQREFFAQFSRRSDDHVVEGVVWICRLCEQLPFRSMKCWVIVACVTMILEIRHKLFCLSIHRWDQHLDL